MNRVYRLEWRGAPLCECMQWTVNGPSGAHGASAALAASRALNGAPGRATTRHLSTVEHLATERRRSGFHAPCSVQVCVCAAAFQWIPVEGVDPGGWKCVIIIIIIPMAMFIVLSSWPQVIARVHSLHLMNVEQRQAAVDPQTKPPDLGCESAGPVLGS